MNGLFSTQQPPATAARVEDDARQALTAHRRPACAIELIRAIAFDYDGTLVEGDTSPRPALLSTLAEVRATGRKLILVTGRILAELAHVFPDFASCFDVVVAENGAVIYRNGATRNLAVPVPFELDRALVELGIPFKRGQVLLACDAEYELDVLRELRGLGADCQLVRNRAALMVLPAAMSKGSGLYEALADLGISHHSALGVGDAENDLSLLQICEIGVAVGNAVPRLKDEADVTLEPANGHGVEYLLRSAVLERELEFNSTRWRIELGRTADGAPVRLPASPSRILVAGGSGAGKSYAIGLIAERLIQLRYSVCVFDPEGDHVPLARLRGVYLAGGRKSLPEPEELPDLLSYRMGSVVVDLSLVGTTERALYVRRALDCLRPLRAERGLPHWIVMDEAHEPLHDSAGDDDPLQVGDVGICAATYRPDDLGAGLRRGANYLIALTGSNTMELEALAALGDTAGVGAEDLARKIGQLTFGQALVVPLVDSAECQIANLGARWAHHVRHWHKYAGARLPPHRRFYFRTRSSGVAAAAANLAEFHRGLMSCSDDVIAHHAASMDFSRWILDVIQDIELGDDVRTREILFQDVPDPRLVRTELLRLIEDRYLE